MNVPSSIRRYAFVAVLCLITLAAKHCLADNMEPPGAPGDPATRMKSLNEIEPRKTIMSLPYPITNSGSYYLVSNLTAAAGINGLIIETSDVKVDLNGFALNGVSNSLHGIVVTKKCDNITIRNGIIRNWGEYGLMATNATDMVVEDVKSFGNGSGGLYVGQNSVLERCAAYGNGYLAIPGDPPPTDGINVSDYSTVRDCKARKNVGAGIHAGRHCRIIECTTTESRDANGIWAEGYCTIRDCTSAYNWSHGIRVEAMCRVMFNTCGENGFRKEPPSSPNPGTAGIAAEGDSNIIENNNVAGNVVGIKSMTAGNLVLHNCASRNTNDFAIGGASSGPMVDMTGGGIVTNTSPWANFKFGAQY